MGIGRIMAENAHGIFSVLFLCFPPVLPPGFDFAEVIEAEDGVSMLMRHCAGEWVTDELTGSYLCARA